MALSKHYFKMLNIESEIEIDGNGNNFLTGNYINEDWD